MVVADDRERRCTGGRGADDADDEEFGIPRALVPLSEHDSKRIECGIALK